MAKNKTLFETATAEEVALLKRIGSPKREESVAAMENFAEAIILPLRQGIMAGDIVTDIFQRIDLQPGVNAEFPLDFLAPGTEKDYVAYAIPSHGRTPEKKIEGDYVTIPTFDIGNTISWNLKYARDARWDLVSKALRTMRDGFVKKTNDDGWHVLLAAGVDRNILVFDADASAGQFTKRLISLMKVVMRRNGGGNSTSINRGKLTDLYLSPEALEDMRDWKIDQVDDITRREIYVADDGTINRVFSVNLHDIDELGEDQEYQSYFTNELGGTLASGDVELVVGLDLRSEDSFVMPIRADVEIYPDDQLHRRRMAGYYGWKEHGFGVLDSRRVIVGSL
jgi:hypothetical protein